MNVALKILVYFVALALIVLAGWLSWIFVVNFNHADPSVKASLIGLFGMFLVALIANYYTRKREIDARHFANKREGYMQLIDMIFDSILSIKNNENLTEEEMLHKMISFKKSLLIWGGPNIIEAWNNFESKSVGNIDPKETLKEMEKVLRKIRKDLGHDDSPLKFGALSDLLLIAEDKGKLFG